MKNQKINIYILLIHLLLWLLLLSIPMVFFSNMGISFLPLKRIVILNTIIISVFYINYSGLAPLFLFKKRFLLYFASLIVVLFSVWWFINYLENNDRIEPHPTFFHELRKPGPTRENESRSKVFIMVNLALISLGTSIKATEQWLNNEKEKNQIKEEKRNAELSLLKSQIDPHFFFNTLNNIYSLTSLKSDKAPQTILKLSELMRYNIYESDKDMVLLKDEINYIQNFIDLQKIRLPKNADIDYYVRGNIGERKIEPLLFLPFIENSFKHGVDYANNCSIDIEITIEEKEITLLVINNTMNRKDKISRESGVGLSNIKQRLELLYKNRYELKISENEKSFMVKLILYLNEH